MASGNETPRQKMIGMMYLVLTALLALNVSKEILNAFIVVDDSLKNTNINFAANNGKLYGEFDHAKSVDPLRVTPNWTKAQQVKKLSIELDNYILNIQREMVMKTEGVEKQVSDTLHMAFMNQKDNYDIPTHMMIGDSEDGSKGLSRELKDKVLAYKTELEKLILPADKSAIKLGINLDNPKNTEENQNWEMYNFFHTPLAAAITILSKMQSDVKNAESIVVSYLLEKSAGDIIPFDTVAPKVIPQSNYVLLGDEYKADVFVAAFSKTKNPKVMADLLNAENTAADGSLDSLVVDKGVGKYTYKPNREGIFKWGGNISVLSASGKKITYPFQSEYIVARPSVNVSADNMNVFYMGLKNPVTISVPGVPNERIKPFFSQGNGTITAIGNGKYEISVTSEGKAIVSVNATFENGETRNMGGVEYRSKALPKPNPQIGGRTTGGKVPKNFFCSQEGLAAKYDPSFVFSVTPKIISFSITIYRGNMFVFDGKSTSGYYTAEMKPVLCSLRKGDKVIISEIEALGSDGRRHNLSEMVFQIQ